jgi:hypothetical protein
MDQLTQWTQVAVILAGYVLGGYLQKRHIDDFRDSVNKRFDELDTTMVLGGNVDPGT